MYAKVCTLQLSSVCKVNSMDQLKQKGMILISIFSLQEDKWGCLVLDDQNFLGLCCSCRLGVAASKGNLSQFQCDSQ